MAISKTITRQTLTLKVENGVNTQGAVKTKGHNYSGVRPEAAPEAVMKAATALSGLIGHELLEVIVTETAQLEE